jgi:hypothetical protein
MIYSTGNMLDFAVALLRTVVFTFLSGWIADGEAVPLNFGIGWVPFSALAPCLPSLCFPQLQLRRSASITVCNCVSGRHGVMPRLGQKCPHDCSGVVGCCVGLVRASPQLEYLAVGPVGSFARSAPSAGTAAHCSRALVTEEPAISSCWATRLPLSEPL